MKNVFIVSIMLISQIIGFSQTCEKVFVSEVVFSKDSTQTLIGSSTTWIENYALELYNPTTADIDLSLYSVRLIPQIGSPTIITLTDSIKAQATYVISKLGAVSDLISVAEMITSSLDYDNFVAIEVYEDTILLDRVGKVGLSVSDSINLAQAMADPANYLNSLNFDLSSLEKLVFRRNPIVGSGNADFDSTSKEWYVAPNGDYTDIHHHTNICKETDVIVEFTDEIYYSIEGIKVHPTITFYNYDDVSMHGQVTVAIQQVSNPPYVLPNPYYASVNEIVPTTITLELPIFVADILPIVDNQIEPTETMMYKLSVVPIISQGAAHYNAKVNPAKQYTTILIQDAIFTGVENSLNDIKASIYPNPTSSHIEVKYLLPQNAEVEINISNLMGQVIQKMPIERKIAGNQHAKISIGDMASGMYILQIKTDCGSFTTKFVKN